MERPRKDVPASRQSSVVNLNPDTLKSIECVSNRLVTITALNVHQKSPQMEERDSNKGNEEFVSSTTASVAPDEKGNCDIESIKSDITEYETILNYLENVGWHPLMEDIVWRNGYSREEAKKSFSDNLANLRQKLSDQH